jgi:hypothetical protein
MTKEELRERILAQYDPDQLVDLLGLTSEELLDAFDERVTTHRFPELNLEDTTTDEEDSE